MALSCAALAQSAPLAFGTIKADPTLPVEVTADTLNVDQTSGQAEFAGNVRVGQGEMRLSAETVMVVYKTEGKGIERLEALGNVVLVNGPDAAEAERADYSIDSGLIVMTGNVLLTQGQNALTSDRLEVDLTLGTARMAGRVKSILQPEGD